jgi:hypothetical protein
MGARAAGVNGKGFGLLGGYVLLALVPRLVAKPDHCVNTKTVRVRV